MTIVIVAAALFLPTYASAGVILNSDLLVSHAAGNLAMGQPGDQAQPAVAYDPLNNLYLSVWTDYRNVNSSACGAQGCGTDIYGALCQGTDNPGQGLPNNVTTMACGDSFLISTSGGTNPAAGYQAQPKVAFYPDYATPANSKYLVVWTDSRSGNSQIYGQFISTPGAPIGSNFTISQGAGIFTGPNLTGIPATINYTSTNQSDPDIIYDTVINRFVVVWLDINDYDPSQIVSFQGVDCTNFSGDYNYAPLAYSDNNQILTIEVSPTTGVDPTTLKQASTIVFTQTFVVAGDTLRATFRTQKNESKPKLTFSSITGDYFPAWSGMDHTITFSVTATVVGTCLSPGTYSCACNYGNATLTDRDNDITPRIKLRKNNGLGLVQDLSFGTIATSPSLVTDPNTNRVLVAWEENTGAATGFDILGWLADLSNFLDFGNAINISTATGDQTFPAASFDNVNQRYFVTWEDARNQSANISNIDIYGQFVDPQGNLSGANIPVTTAPGNQLEPAMAFGGVDFSKFLIAWADGRDPSQSDIYGQLLEFSELPQLLITDGNGNPILNGSINFGNVNVGQVLDIPFKLCNEGNTQLTINSMTSPDAPFSFTTPIPQTISPGSGTSTCYDMNVRFTPTAAGSYSGNPNNNYETVIQTNGGNVTLYFSGNGIGVQPLSVTTTSVPDGSNGSPYGVNLMAYGGVFPYAWSISSGSLPAGLSLQTSGTCLTVAGTLTCTANVPCICGTPTVSGTFAFTVQVTDNNSPHTSASRPLSISVSAITVSPASLAQWTQNKPGYSETLTASNGFGPYTWSIVGQAQGSNGCSGTDYPINSTNTGLCLTTGGIIRGTPTVSGSYNFSVTAKDTTNQTATVNYSVTINPSPAILTSSLPLGVVGVAYNQTLFMTGGTPSITWTITSGALPPGLVLNSGTGAISGTPTGATASPTPTFTVQVTDSVGASTSQILSLQINPVLDISTPATGNGAPPDATAGAQYLYAFTPTGGNPPYSWAVVAGSLPDGLSLNSFTGYVFGTPSSSAVGKYNFNLELSDVNGNTKIKSYSINVFSQLVITTAALKTWSVGTAYSDSVSATGGKAPFTWSIISGSLPNGLNIASGTGVISGTPTAAGTFSFTVQATDQASAAATKALSILINPPGFTAPAILAQPGSIDFGNHVVGSTKDQSITVSNVGTADLTIQTATIDDPAKPFMISGNTCNAAVQPGQTCQITVRYAPSAVGSFNANLVMTSNAGNAPTLSIGLTGSSLPAPVIRLLPDSIDFGSTAVGSTSDIKSVEITNAGGSSLVISFLTYPSNPFKVVADHCSGQTLAPQASCSVDIVFIPNAAVIFNPYYLTVSTSDPTNPTARVTLMGRGVWPAPEIGLSPTSIDFGSVKVGTGSAKYTVTVTNNGTARLVFSSIIYPTLPFKVVTDNCAGRRLKPNASCTMVLKFKPTAYKTYPTRYLTFKTNDAVQPKARVALNGTGTR